MDDVIKKVYHDVKSCAAKLQFVVEDHRSKDIDDSQFKDELMQVTKELQELINSL